MGWNTTQMLLARVLDRVQELENEGYQFEAAEASFVLLVDRLAQRHNPCFQQLGFHVSVSRMGRVSADRSHNQGSSRRSFGAHRERGRWPGQRARRCAA